MAAGRGEQDSAGRNQLSGLAHQLAISFDRHGDVFPRLREGGRIDDDDIAALPGGGHRIERLEHLLLADFAAVGNAVKAGRPGRRFQRRCRPVEKRDRSGAGQGGRDAETAAIAIGIENPRIVGESGDECPAVPLIVEPAGLLPTQRIDLEARAVLDQLDRCR